MGAAPIETSPDSRFQVEASVAGDFHEPAAAPHTTIIETEPGFREEIAVLDMEPGQVDSVGRATAPHRARAMGAPRDGSPARARQGSRHKPRSRRKLRAQ